VDDDASPPLERIRAHLPPDVLAVLERVDGLSAAELEQIKAAYVLARSRKETEIAEEKRLKNEARRGDLVSRSEVEAANVSKFRAIRAAFELLPSRVARTVAGLDDPRDCEVALREEVARIVEELYRA
jgi:phage terminase Nu1 subunit (DNA packaging protein)